MWYSSFDVPGLRIKELPCIFDQTMHNSRREDERVERTMILALGTCPRMAAVRVLIRDMYGDIGCRRLEVSLTSFRDQTTKHIKIERKDTIVESAQLSG